MTAFITHFTFEFKTGIRNRSLLFLNYLFPMMFYVMMGFVMPALNPMFLDVLIPAMVTFAALAATLMGIPDPLVSARESGIFRSYKINGIPRDSILAIPALSTMLHVTVVAALIVVTAPLLFGAPLPVNWFVFVLTFLALAANCASLGLLIGVVSPSTRMTIFLAQVVFIPCMLIGGLMIPHSMLPTSVQRLALLLPTTYAMNLFRGPAMGQAADFDPLASGLILAGATLLAITLSVVLFSWDRQNNGRRVHPALALLVLVPYGLGMIFL